MAENFLSPLEARAVRRSLCRSGNSISLYNAWTRREAYVKAHGEDLCVSGRSLEFSLDPGRTDLVVDSEDVPWSIRAFHPAPGRMMAVALEGEHCQPKFWRWNASEGCGDHGRAGLVLAAQPDAEGRVEERLHERQRSIHDATNRITSFPPRRSLTSVPGVDRPVLEVEGHITKRVRSGSTNPQPNPELCKGLAKRLSVCLDKAMSGEAGTAKALAVGH